MTPDQRAAARRRCKAVPAGPWDVDDFDTILAVGSKKGRHVASVSTKDEGWGEDPKQDQTDRAIAAFIAHARTDLPAALAELDRLEALERRLCEVFGIPYPIHDPGGLDWTHFYKAMNELEGEVERLKGELADRVSRDGSAPECRASKRNKES